jgi:predicted acetyltransferase
MTIDIQFIGPELHAEATAPLRVAFGLHFDPERSERMQRLPDFLHRIAAFERGKIVGVSGSFDFTMTTPGAEVRTAGLTMVAVLPTHRRRGVLTGMMRKHFEDARDKGLPISALWASEGSIYGRFGYGVASLAAGISLERDRAHFHRPPPRNAVFHLLDDAEARAAFPPIYDRVRPTIAGMYTRSPLWWEYRRLADDKSLQPMQRVIMEIDGKPEGYAIYRMTERLRPPGIIRTNLGVVEALATSPAATTALWRYLCDVDLVRRIEARLLTPTHPLFHLVLEPRRLRMTVEEALWVRLVDAEAALAARAFPAHDAISFALHDAFCPWNSGVYRVAEGQARRAHASPDLKLDASALGSLYLGGIGARQLADAGLVEELTPGAVDRATALFLSPRAPWCPEIF